MHFYANYVNNVYYYREMERESGQFLHINRFVFYSNKMRKIDQFELET